MVWKMDSKALDQTKADFRDTKVLIAAEEFLLKMKIKLLKNLFENMRKTGLKDQGKV